MPVFQKKNILNISVVKKKANCYVLGDCVKYDQPKKLEDFGINVAPQAWLYVNEVE